MGEYIVKGAKAICKYGTSVGQLQVNDNTGVTMNGNRTATTNSLGNTFFPNFGTCSLHNNCPCTPAIVKWEKYYDLFFLLQEFPSLLQNKDYFQATVLLSPKYWG